MFEKTRNLLNSLGLGGMIHPKDPEAQSPRAASAGLYDQATDGSPYLGVKVPPPQVATESSLAPPPRLPESGIETLLASARQEVLALRRDVVGVMKEFFLAGGLTPDAVGKRMTEIFGDAQEPCTTDHEGGAGVEQFQADLLDLRRDLVCVMANLLIGSGWPQEVARKVAIEPLRPKTGKGSKPPEDSGPETEMQRFEQEVGRLCDRIFGATEIRGQEVVPETRPNAPDRERRPAPTPKPDRSWDRGHER